MLESILGSLVREQVLVYLHAFGEGYARQIADYFHSSLDSVQKQLKRLECDDVLISRRFGRTIVYEFSDEFPFRSEIGLLVEKLIELDADSYGKLATTPEPAAVQENRARSIVRRRYDRLTR